MLLLLLHLVLLSLLIDDNPSGGRGVLVAAVTTAVPTTGAAKVVVQSKNKGSKKQDERGEASSSCPSSSSSSAKPTSNPPSSTKKVSHVYTNHQSRRRKPPIKHDPPLICFIALGLPGHVVPMMRLAEEMVIVHGYNATLATHDSVRHLFFAEAPHVRFLSLGPLPISPSDLRHCLHQVSKATSNFRGLLRLLNEVYFTLALPLYDILLPLLQRPDNTPDLLVIDIGAAAAGVQDLAETLPTNGGSIPLIYNSPTLPFRFGAALSARSGGASSSHYMPAWGTGLSVHMSLFDRCLNLLFPFLLSIACTSQFLTINKVR